MILYSGPSAINHELIVVIVTGLPARRKDGAFRAAKIGNAKTGAEAQAWVLPQADIKAAISVNHDDVAVCGTCPARRAVGKRRCYTHKATRIGRGAAQVWRTWARGGYPTATSDRLADLAEYGIRWGAYGDPLAIPMETLRSEAWAPLILAKIRTGYTHRWLSVRPGDRPFVAGFLMASVDNEAGTRAAIKLGFRYFRIRGADEPLIAGEVVCPASKEAGYLTDCHACQACNGTQFSPNRANIAIIAH